jgi:hypothetical protein
MQGTVELQLQTLQERVIAFATMLVLVSSRVICVYSTPLAQTRGKEQFMSSQASAKGKDY